MERRAEYSGLRMGRDSVADACWMGHHSLMCPRCPVHCLRVSCRETGLRSTQCRASLPIPRPSGLGYSVYLSWEGWGRMIEDQGWALGERDESTIKDLANFLFRRPEGKYPRLWVLRSPSQLLQKWPQT